MPKLHRWVDEATRKDILVAYHPYGYGGYGLKAQKGQNVRLLLVIWKVHEHQFQAFSFQPLPPSSMQNKIVGETLLNVTGASSSQGMSG